MYDRAEEIAKLSKGVQFMFALQEKYRVPKETIEAWEGVELLAEHVVRLTERVDELTVDLQESVKACAGLVRDVAEDLEAE